MNRISELEIVGHSWFLRSLMRQLPKRVWPQDKVFFSLNYYLLSIDIAKQMCCWKSITLESWIFERN